MALICDFCLRVKTRALGFLYSIMTQSSQKAIAYIKQIRFSVRKLVRCVLLVYLQLNGCHLDCIDLRTSYTSVFEKNKVDTFKRARRPPRCVRKTNEFGFREIWRQIGICPRSRAGAYLAPRSTPPRAEGCSAGTFDSLLF